MVTGLARSWWVFLLRGFCGVFLAAVAFASPITTLYALVILWGAYAVAEGFMAVWSGIADDDRRQRRWFLVIVGLAGIVAGIGAWLWPGLTALVLLSIIGVWSIVRGVFEMAAAVSLRKVIDNEWLLFTAGALSMLFGLVLLVRPAVGLVALVWMIGAYALVNGVLLIMLAFKLRRLGRAA